MNWTTLIRNRYTGALAAMLIVAAPLVAGKEGLRTHAYLDAVSVWTICYGETHNVKQGDVQSEENCGIMMVARLAAFGTAVDFFIKQDMSPETHAAFTSFAYNVGIQAFRNSTLARLYNEGKKVEACNQLPRWNRAKGRVLKGLVIRREEEKQLCLKGLSRPTHIK